LTQVDPLARSVEYGYFHGYTLADKKGIEPAFAFGYGLSYTRFVYSKLRLSTAAIAADGALDVSVEVANAGTRAGEEVVQLYAGFPRSVVERPVKLLRGFAKVSLAAGEVRTIHLRLAGADLAYYDVGAHAWRVESTEYTVQVGGSSRTRDLLSATFRVQG
jgi:beta-glucosidase